MQAAEERVPVCAAPVEDVLPVLQEEPPHKTMEPRKLSVPAMDNHHTVVVNTMETVVLSKLESVLARFQCCRCDRCKKDIVALALNKLPPKYRVMPESAPLPDLDTQENAQIVTALIQAVIQVRAKPRH